MVRDSQRQRLYKAERKPAFFHGDRFSTFEQAAAFGYSILNSEWFKQRFPGCPKIRFEKARGNAKSSFAQYYRGIIKLLPSHYCKAVVCHEIAHFATIRLAMNRGIGLCASHGPEFAHIYAGMVAEFVGASEALELLAAFDAAGVGYSLRKA